MPARLIIPGLLHDSGTAGQHKLVGDPLAGVIHVSILEAVRT